MKVEAWTDGSSVGEIGPGGWGVVAVVDDGDELVEWSDGAERTTNQRMELIAALVALRGFAIEDEITIYSDSAYLINGMTKRWYERWERNGWRNAAGKPVKNRDLWSHLVWEARQRRVTWVKVEAHVPEIITDSHRYNARADALAVRQKQKFIEKR